MNDKGLAVILAITGAELYKAKKATTICDAVIEAIANGANLRGANLCSADLCRANLYGVDLCGVDLCGANLCGANLCGANLCSADLRRANLYGVNLCGANLCGADLCRANLRSADLRGVKNIKAERITPLLMLLDQPGKIRAYKLVNENSEGHVRGGLKYEIGKWVSITDANIDANEDCGAGINVATLDWCLAEWREGYKVLIVEFTAKDIAAIPTATDGKFRLHRCKVVDEKDISELVKKISG